MKQKQLYLVDASIYVFRAYFSIPPNFVDREGRAVNAVYGYTGFLMELLKVEPDFVSVAFDESLTTCFRNTIYPAYKANRELPDENLKYQLDRCQEITRLLGFHSLVLKDFEADDIIGTLATRHGVDKSVVIVTRDKDLGQLLREQDQMWDFAANEFAGVNEVRQKFGVHAHQLADYLALAGDTVDNIPGAPGIGAKTAATLLGEFETLDALFAGLDTLHELGFRGAGRVQKILTNHESEVRLYRRLTEIKRDVPMQVSEADLHLAEVDTDGVENFFDQLSFGEAMRRRLQTILQ